MFAVPDHLLIRRRAGDGGHTPPQIYRFGPFVLDRENYALARDGVPVEVQPKVVDLLLALIERGGELCTREHLFGTVWPDVVVGDDALSQMLMKARQALGDSPRSPCWIRTVHGRGYRFVGEVTTGEAPVLPAGVFGREVELAQARQALEAGARLITWTGPGGIGKTTLARVLLAEREGWFVDVSPAVDEVDLATRIAEALGQPIPAGDGGALERLRASLAAARGVLVLDNAETGLKDVRRALELWMPACTGVAFVVTSRVALGVAGEEVHAVGPLSPSAGVALLRDRIERRDPVRAGAVSDPELEALAAAVDGHPLALDLVSTRVQVASPAHLVGLLPDRLEVIATDHPERSGRHRSLDALLESSWEDLSVSQRAALVRLAAFRGPVDAALAEAVLPDGEDPLGVLEHLEARSWLISGGSGLRMLLLVRAWVEQTPEGRAGADEARERHARAVLGAAPSWEELPIGGIGIAAQGLLGRLAADLTAVMASPDPSTAAEAALRLALLRDAHGLGLEALALVDRLDVDALPPRLGARAELAASLFLRGGVSAREGLQRARRAEERAREAGASDLLRYAWVRQADACFVLGEAAAARELCGRVLGAAPPEDHVTVRAYSILGKVLRRLAEPGAEDAHREGLRVARRLDDDNLLQSLHNDLATSLGRLGRLDESLRHTREALAAARRAGRAVPVVGLGSNLAFALRRAGRTAEARGVLFEALEQARTLGDLHLHGFVAMGAANAVADLGDTDDSLPLYDEATSAFEEIPRPAAAAGSELNRALTLVCAGRGTEGRRLLAEVLRVGTSLADPVLRYRAHFALAAAALLAREPEETLAQADAGIALVGRSEGSEWRVLRLALRGGALALAGDRAGSEAFAQLAPDLDGLQGAAPWRARALEALVLEPGEARRRLAEVEASGWPAQDRLLRALIALVRTKHGHRPGS